MATNDDDAPDSEPARVPAPRDEDVDRIAILRRRAVFVASAIAGLGFTPGCGDSAQPRPCLDVAPTEVPTEAVSLPPPQPCLSPPQPCLEIAMPEDAGAPASADGGVDAGTDGGRPGPCLRIAPPQRPPPPQPCLDMPPPQTCLKMAPPDDNDAG